MYLIKGHIIRLLYLYPFHFFFTVLILLNILYLSLLSGKIKKYKEIQKYIVKFLISKDKSGRTVVHSSSCPRASCTCPKRLAAGSVDSLMGRLRAIFNNLGRLNDSNPVAHPLVKRYLKFVRQRASGFSHYTSSSDPFVFR